MLIKEKIVFEVLSSQIPFNEIKKRVKDYSSIGFSVIWVLYDQVYNQIITCQSERYLRKYYSTYFFSLAPNKEGFFYDQFEYFKGMQRLQRGPPLVIKNFFPKRLLQIQKNFPNFLKEKKSLIYLSGDIIDQLVKTPSSNKIKNIEKNYDVGPIKKFFNLGRLFFLYQLYLNAK